MFKMITTILTQAANNPKPKVIVRVRNMKYKSSVITKRSNLVVFSPRETTPWMTGIQLCFSPKKMNPYNRFSMYSESV